MSDEFLAEEQRRKEATKKALKEDLDRQVEGLERRSQAYHELSEKAKQDAKKLTEE